MFSNTHPEALLLILLAPGGFGLAAFGTLYLSQFSHPSRAATTHAFALITATFAVVALIAAAAYKATHVPVANAPPDPRSNG